MRPVVIRHRVAGFRSISRASSRYRSAGTGSAAGVTVMRITSMSSSPTFVSSYVTSARSLAARRRHATHKEQFKKRIAFIG